MWMRPTLARSGSLIRWSIKLFWCKSQFSCLVENAKMVLLLLGGWNIAATELAQTTILVNKNASHSQKWLRHACIGNESLLKAFHISHMTFKQFPHSHFDKKWVGETDYISMGNCQGSRSGYFLDEHHQQIRWAVSVGLTGIQDGGL